MMKRVLLVGLVLVAGCKKKESASGGGGDCDVVAKDPAHAMVEITKRYPKDPVKVAQTIENCVAPTGDECERVAAMVKAIPAMTPGTAAPRSADEYAKTCRESPPAMRKCFLASYALAHDAECKQMMADMVTAQVALEPKKPACDGGTVIVYVVDEGTWVVTGKDPAARCFGKRQGKALNASWLETELSQFKTKDCKPSVEVVADKDVKYQDVISAMDVAVKVGMVDTALASPSDLPVTFKTGEEDKSPEHCPATTIATADMVGSGAGSSAPVAGGRTAPAPMAGTDAMKTATLVIVTRDEISISSGTGAAATHERLVTVKEAASGSGVIKELAKSLPKAASADAPLILQADQETSAIVVNRIVETAKAAGYVNVLFAVKNK